MRALALDLISKHGGAAAAGGGGQGAGAAAAAAGGAAVEEAGGGGGAVPRGWAVGFHSVPSMARLHLHVISTDMDSPALKNKV